MKPTPRLVNEIFLSVQGESSWAGLPCVFVRLTGCDLRCTYCDTAYAFTAGTRRPLADVLAEALAFDCPLVELTGGEPLLQPAALPLMATLCDAGRTVLLETNGAHDIAPVDPRVHRIVDLKTPTSGESARNLWSNIAHLTPRDEVKFVIASREDYAWACEQIHRWELPRRVKTVLLSPVFGSVEPREIVEWMLGNESEEKSEKGEVKSCGKPPSLRQFPNVRFQLQMHKFIWPPDQRGV